MERNVSFPVLVFACRSFSFPPPEWSSSLYAVFFSFLCYPKPAGHPTDSASEPDLTVSRHPAPQKSGRQVPVLVAILVG